jgi:hypothetical protein
VTEAVGVHADRARFEQLLERLQAAGSEDDRLLYAHALAAGRDAGRAREFLAAALAGIIAPHIASAIPRMVSEDSPFGAMAYGFTLTHWDALAALAGSVGKNWLLPNAAVKFNDVERAEALLADQRRNAGEDGASPAARVAARIRLLAAVKRRDAAGIEQRVARWVPAD